VKRPPFKMLPSRQASLSCDGKFVCGGRASYVWETFLMRRIAGVPGDYVISARGTKKHRLDWTIEEAEAEMVNDRQPNHMRKVFSERRLQRGRQTRAARERRGLPVG